MTDRVLYILAGAVTTVVGLFLGFSVYEAGYTDGRQSMPMACEAKCDTIMRNGKVLKVVSSDATGVMRWDR